MNTSIILIIVVLGIYLAWKLMGTGNKKRHDQRRFSTRKHRKNRMGEDDDDDE